MKHINAAAAAAALKPLLIVTKNDGSPDFFPRLLKETF